MKTEKLLSLKEYLIALQEAGYNIEDVEKAKAEYRKKFKSHYNQAYNKAKKRRTVVLTREEDQLLCKASELSGMKPGAFIKQSTFAVLQKTSLVVREDLVFKAVSATQKVGNLINQWVRISHQKNDLYLKDILASQQMIKTLSMEVREILTQPHDLVQEVDQNLTTNPKLLMPLAKVILKHITSETNGGYR